MNVEKDHLWVQKRSKLKHERWQNIIKWVVRLIWGQSRLLFSIFCTSKKAVCYMGYFYQYKLIKKINNDVNQN